MAIVMNTHGKDLDDDVEYQRRLAANEIKPPAPAGEITLLPFAKRSVAIFLTAVAAICVFGVFEGLRPTIPAEGGGVEPLSVTPIIQMFMLTAAALILVLAHVKASDIPNQQIFRSGMVAMIALFGIAWMADTFIANNEDAIVAALGSLAEKWPFTIALAIFLVAALTTSQSAATRTMIPLGLGARDRRGLHDRVLDRRRRRALLPRQRHPDRRRRGRRDRLDDARQARRSTTRSSSRCRSPGW